MRPFECEISTPSHRGLIINDIGNLTPKEFINKRLTIPVILSFIRRENFVDLKLISILVTRIVKGQL